MSTALRTKLRSLSTAHFLRNLRSFSSIDNGVGRSDNPPEPIPFRPLRGQSYPSQSPQFPNPNCVKENENLNSIRAETNADFLERLHLGYDTKTKNPESVDNEEIQSEKAETAEPLSADVIFNRMKETGLIPNAIDMLDGLCKDGLVEEAMNLLVSVRDSGTIPRVVMYTAVVEGFCRARKFDDAIRVFNKMKSNGVVPNAYSYQVLIRRLCGAKRLEEAYAFTIEMLEAGHSPNVATFTGLIDVYCREKGLEEAKNVIGAMRMKGFFVEKKAVREFLDKKGSFFPLVWEAILGMKAPDWFLL